MKQQKQNHRKTYMILIGFSLLVLVIGLIGAYAWMGRAHDGSTFSKPTRSYGTGRIVITFKKGTSYQTAEKVLSELKLTNAKPDFMELHINIDIPVSVQSSPVSELNKFYAKIDSLKQMAEVDHFSSPTVYFKPTISESVANRLILNQGLNTAKNSSFEMSYVAEVNIRAGTEPKIIEQLSHEPSVQKAAEPVVVPM